jgi:hypothetical protein
MFHSYSYNICLNSQRMSFMMKIINGPLIFANVRYICDIVNHRVDLCCKVKRKHFFVRYRLEFVLIVIFMAKFD